MRIFRKTTLSALTVSLLASAAAMPAYGQIEEIIVTAEKREASVQDTAIAITAFTDELMDDLGISGAADIANYTPGMTYNASPNRIFIRGIGRVENSLGSEPGVAIYRDGIYTNEAASVSDNSFFVDGIEVLRGPQGTLYGRNAIGGAANVHTKRPTDEFVGEARVDAYNYGGRGVALSLSGPITDRIRYRVSGGKQVHDGWIENIAGGNQNDLDFTTWEVQLEVDLTESLSVWVRYNDYEWDQNRAGGVMISPYNTNLATDPCRRPIGDFSNDFLVLVASPQCGYGEENPGVKDIHKVNHNEEGFIKSPGRSITSHVTWDREKWQFKYIYGTNAYDWEYLADFDKTALDGSLQYIAQFEDYTQHELQAISDLGGKFEYIFGLFKYHQETWQPYTLFSPSNSVLENNLVGWIDYYGDPNIYGPPIYCNCILDASEPNPERIFYDQTGDLETDSWAAYAQIDHYINDQWHVSLGARFSHDEKIGYEDQKIIWQDSNLYYASNVNPWYHFFWFPYDGTGGPALLDFSANYSHYAPWAWDFTDGTISETYTEEWESFDWSIGVDYKPNDDTMYYAKVSTGYKAGGFRLGSLQEDQGVESESVLAYEAGMKTTLNDVFQVNVAAYYYDYEDMQVPVNAVISGVQNLLFLNAKEATQWGIEVDANWAVSDSFNLF